MKTIVITGSTRGIGYGLADSLLALGCAVTVSGRALASVEKAVAELAAKHEPGRVLGQPCDVTDFEQAQALWDAAKAHFGKVDI
jgi:NAD(P)-dependent dehydrogenase (short-subunit alcohol dehydrogenase family)